MLCITGQTPVYTGVPADATVFLQQFEAIILAFGLIEALLPPSERTILVPESVRIAHNEMAMALINAACGRFPDLLVLDCEPEAKVNWIPPVSRAWYVWKYFHSGILSVIEFSRVGVKAVHRGGEIKKKSGKFKQNESPAKVKCDVRRSNISKGLLLGLDASNASASSVNLPSVSSVSSASVDVLISSSSLNVVSFDDLTPSTCLAAIVSPALFEIAVSSLSSVFGPVDPAGTEAVLSQHVEPDALSHSTPFSTATFGEVVSSHSTPPVTATFYAGLSTVPESPDSPLSFGPNVDLHLSKLIELHYVEDGPVLGDGERNSRPEAAPDETRDVPAVASFEDGAWLLRPAPAADEHRGALCNVWRDEKRPRSAPAVDEHQRGTAWCVPDYEWGVRGAPVAEWWRNGVPLRPAPAPDERRGGHNADKWWRDGAEPRPAPAPDESHGAHGAACWRDGALPRPACAPDERTWRAMVVRPMSAPADAAAVAVAGALPRPAPVPDYTWGALPSTWWRDGVVPRPAPAPDEKRSWRDGATIPRTAPALDVLRGALLGATGAIPRPAPASDYAWSALTATWWRNGVPPRPAPAPDEYRSRQRVGWRGDGAALRPAPAPDEFWRALNAAPWCDGAHSAGHVAAGS